MTDTALSNHLTVSPISGTIGAEISGVDLASDLSDATVAQLRQALLDFGVIFFHDQDFDVDTHKRLARRFGDIFVHPNFNTGDHDPEVLTIVREPGDTHIVGEDWHSDTQMMTAPPLGAILLALEVPDYGGDTLFASQYAAYAALSDGMKDLLNGLNVVNSDILVAGPSTVRNDNRTTKSRADDAWRETVSVHPAVRTHPETGRKALFVNHSYSIRFDGMTDGESKPLLDWLKNWGHRPEFTCRFRWRKGSVAFWDNRCSKHIAVDDAQAGRRVMRRIQIAGDRPF